MWEGTEFMLELGRYSLGVGDRFAHQARAQLVACMRAAERKERAKRMQWE